LAEKRKKSQVPKIMLLGLKITQFISIKWVTLLAARIFTTPIKHKIPNREMYMDSNSVQETLFVPKINKKIVVYQYGNSSKKVLLVHGWSGRGTQLVKFADALLPLGYSTISFDAPAHGKSGTKTTLMPEFIASILELERKFGPFEAAIGHSLGGMALLNAVKQGLSLKKLVVIGSGDKIKDITKTYNNTLQLKPIVAVKMSQLFEKRIGEPMENFSAYIAAKQVNIPTLVIHDENDEEVPISCSINIEKHLPKGNLFLTKKLGHRKILGNTNVINKTVQFINEN
jgi:pimeloyl-ACP methyl ester carboxylesterase